MSHTLHVIRLRGPWEYTFTPLPSAGPLNAVADKAAGQDGRLHLPDEWPQLCKLSGCTLQVMRRFGLPTGIESGDQLWLVIDGLQSGSQIQLGSEPLTADRMQGSTAEFDVSTRLKNRNVLTITRAANGEPLFEEARLEIRRP